MATATSNPAVQQNAKALQSKLNKTVLEKLNSAGQALTHAQTKESQGATTILDQIALTAKEIKSRLPEIKSKVRMAVVEANNKSKEIGQDPIDNKLSAREDLTDSAALKG